MRGGGSSQRPQRVNREAPRPKSEAQEGRRTAFKSCQGKRRYRTEGEANDTIAYRMRSPDPPRTPLRVYDCGRCGGWHLSASPLLGTAYGSAPTTGTRFALDLDDGEEVG